MSTGKIIKTLRCKHGLTQDELATILEVKKSSIQKYEANDVPNLKVNTIRRLSDHFNVSANAFIFPERYRKIDVLIECKINERLLEHHQLLLSDLNDEGRKKVFEYAKDLKDSKNYSS